MPRHILNLSRAAFETFGPATMYSTSHVLTLDFSLDNAAKDGAITDDRLRVLCACLKGSFNELQDLTLRHSTDDSLGATITVIAALHLVNALTTLRIIQQAEYNPYSQETRLRDEAFRDAIQAPPNLHSLILSHAEAICEPSRRRGVYPGANNKIWAVLEKRWLQEFLPPNIIAVQLNHAYDDDYKTHGDGMEIISGRLSAYHRGEDGIWE